MHLLQLTARLEVFLGFRLRQSKIAALIALLSPLCLAQNTPKVTLDTSETLFTILGAMNTCGYSQELNTSDPVRKQIRSEIARATHNSDEALEATNLMCQYYHEHVRPDSSRDLAQYISLALYLGDPPNFLPKVKEAELPPDAANVVGFARLAAIVYEKAGFHAIWQKHRDAYTRLTERFHEPLSKTLFDTEIYLKLPSSGYLGRGFAVYLEPMAAESGQCPELWQRILCGDFAIRVGIEDGSDPAYVPALSSGSPVAEVSDLHEAPRAFAGNGERGADGRILQDRHFPAGDRVSGARC